MPNEIPATKTTPSLSNSLFAMTKRGKAAKTARTIRAATANGKRAGERLAKQSFLRGLVDLRSSSLSLTALARAANFSGKRLVLEIRDETPVRIVRTSTKGI